MTTPTGTTLLKGAGQVRYLAMVNLGTGLANLVFSAALVTSFGLMGVAIGTLIPVAVSAIFLVFPASCRRVNLSVSRALRYAIWPAAWPAAVVWFTLATVHRMTNATLGLALLEAAAAGLLYVALFILAVGRRDRANYTARIWELAT